MEVSLSSTCARRPRCLDVKKFRGRVTPGGCARAEAAHRARDCREAAGIARVRAYGGGVVGPDGGGGAEQDSGQPRGGQRPAAGGHPSVAGPNSGRGPVEPEGSSYIVYVTDSESEGCHHM